VVSKRKLKVTERLRAIPQDLRRLKDMMLAGQIFGQFTPHLACE
jgi:hypothetical protein